MSAQAYAIRSGRRREYGSPKELEDTLLAKGFKTVTVCRWISGQSIAVKAYYQAVDCTYSYVEPVVTGTTVQKYDGGWVPKPLGVRDELAVRRAEKRVLAAFTRIKATLGKPMPVKPKPKKAKIPVSAETEE